MTHGSSVWLPSAAVALGNVGMEWCSPSLRDERAVDGRSLARAPFALAIVATADITGLLGFYLDRPGIMLALRWTSRSTTYPKHAMRRSCAGLFAIARASSVMCSCCSVDLDIDLSLAGGSVTGAAS